MGTISTFEKTWNTLKGLLGLAPFFLVQHFSLNTNADNARRLCVIGLMISLYALFELKKPKNDDEVWAINLFNKNLEHPYLIKILGENSKYYTVYQVTMLIKTLF